MFGFKAPVFGMRRHQGSARKHLSSSEWPGAIYAIGDVHGCLAELSVLTQRIVEDAGSIRGEKWIVLLGDYVDRGPNSAGVLDALLASPPAGFRRFVLAGNHEAMMLAFLNSPERNKRWLEFGGDTTLASYGLDAKQVMLGSHRTVSAKLRSHIPEEHIDFLREQPLTLSVPGMVFAHAGLRAGVPVDQQAESDVLWIRDEFFRAAPVPGRLVVHGHTPGPEPVIEPGRICVDTGAYATGILTAVRLSQGEPNRFLSNR